MNETVTLIANLLDPTAIAQLLATHTDDGHGHCRTCTHGAGHGHHTWPCLIHTAATLAATRHE
ncbi:MAG: hypothetical protein ACRDQ0_19370 [Pseudonocardia sp.]